MKSFAYLFTPFLFFFCLVFLGFPSFVQAQDLDRSLPPLIMVVFDTSGSMDIGVPGDISHTRLTIAMSELAGTPKRKATPLRSLYQRNLSPQYARFMRKHKECDEASCRYVPTLYCVNDSSGLCNYLTVSHNTFKINNLNLSLSDLNDPEQHADAYYDDGVVQAYQYSVKFGFAGMAYEGFNRSYIYGRSTFTQNGLTAGKLISDAYKGQNLGMWTAELHTPAPLLYPTVSDKQSDIFASNDAVISSIRTYFPSSNTPIGPILADLYHMFGDYSQGRDPDPGLIKQHVENSTEVVTDHDYVCRPRAVIFVTDGEPTGGGVTADRPEQHGHAKRVWYDAYHLYKSGIKVYMVGYAFDNLKGDSGIGETMNLLAWKGGTCRTFGTYGEIIDPNDYATYRKFIEKGFGNESNICFFDASDSTALRQALVTVLSDMLSGHISRTKIATSSAIGILKNYDASKKTWRNGWYNVLSGYQVTLGHLRPTTLQRETFVCNNSTGYFENDPEQFMDFSERLKTRVEGCMGSNSCINNRFIFGGDYSKDRYALNPALLSLSDPNLGVFDYYDGAVNGRYKFLERDETKPELCEEHRQVSIDNFYTVSQNYYVSPYECAVDLDCAFDEDNRPRHCQVGACIASSKISHVQSCTRPNSCDSGELCFAGKCLKRFYACQKHADCSDNKVCHLGKCVQGTVKNCDLRDFIASAPLGTIEYATPLIVEPPSRGHKSKEYRDFSKKYWLRDSMLYVGANDGLLHAFVLGQNKKDDNYKPPFDDYSGPSNIFEGDERWGFIPKPIFKNLYKLPDYGAQTHINAAPVASDVKFPGDKEWHSVLVGGFREGGRGYYALDVSDPSLPRILWEIDHQWQSKTMPELPDVYDNSIVTVEKDSSNDSKLGYPFLRLGLTYPSPVITNVIIGDKVEPVAILSGGEPHRPDEGNLSGQAVYVVRLDPETREDLLVKAFHFDTAITGTPAVYPNNFNSIAKLIYVGDKNGALHRIDISDTNVSQWTQNVDNEGNVLPIFDPNTFTGTAVAGKRYEKITYPPAVSTIRPEGQVNAREDIQLAFGSGSSDNLNIGESALNYVAVMVDHYDAEADKYKLNPYQCDRQGVADGSCAFASQIILFNTTGTSLASEENIQLTLAKYDKQYYSVYITDPMTDKALSTRQKMTGPALTYNFQNYFPTFIAAKTDATCAYGNAAIWRLSGAQKQKSHQKLGQERVQNKATEGLAFEDMSYFELASGTTVYGLELSKQAFCLKGDAKTATTGFAAAPQLVAQTGGETAGFKSTADGDHSEKLRGDSTDINTIALNLEAIQPEAHVISWASVYE